MKRVDSAKCLSVISPGLSIFLKARHDIHRCQCLVPYSPNKTSNLLRSDDLIFLFSNLLLACFVIEGFERFEYSDVKGLEYMCCTSWNAKRVNIVLFRKLNRFN